MPCGSVVVDASGCVVVGAVVVVGAAEVVVVSGPSSRAADVVLEGAVVPGAVVWVDSSAVHPAATSAMTKKRRIHVRRIPTSSATPLPPRAL
jgi:hypothetical protein